MAICRERVTYLPRNLQEPVSPWKHVPKITVGTCSSGHDTLSGENRAQPAAVAAWVSPSFGTPPSPCIRPFPPTSVVSPPPWKARGASRLGHLGAGRVTLRVLRETLQRNVLEWTHLPFDRVGYLPGCSVIHCLVLKFVVRDPAGLSHRGWEGAAPLGWHPAPLLGLWKTAAGVSVWADPCVNTPYASFIKYLYPLAHSSFFSLHKMNSFHH